MSQERGKIRVGTGKVKYENFIPIVVMTPSNSKKWYPLSPYSLKDENGYIMENIWQFSKVYESVPNSIQRYSRWDQKIIWQHHAEIHVEDGEPNQRYFDWRLKGFKNPFAVRYPVGQKHRKNCLFLMNDEGERYGWIESRKNVYLPLYVRLAKKTKEFKMLKDLLDKGKNLLIIEVDGPREESLEYYKEKYQVGDDFIEKGTILVTEENMQIMIHDSRHPFGHGYCLAMALLDMV